MLTDLKPFVKMKSKSDGTLSDLNRIGSFTFWKRKQSGMHSINFVEMCASWAAEVLGYELLRVLPPPPPPPGGILKTMFFIKGII